MLILLVTPLLFVAACATKTQPAITAAPTLAELPRTTIPRRSIAARIGVEGAAADRRVVWVRPFPEVTLSDEEKAILGEEQQPDIDLLKFYRPRRDVAHGILPERGGMRVARFGLGGVSAGVDRAIHNYGVSDGLAGVAVGASFEMRRPAAAGGGWRNSVGIGPRSPRDVGINPPRRPAVQHTIDNP